MFRRSSIIFAASLALLSTLDSATCFAAAAPAQPREDVDRPRFLKKEIRRFVFTNDTTSRSVPPDEVSTSDLEALHETLTSSSLPDLGADTTPTSATSAITTTSSVTLSDNGQSSTLDLSSVTSAISTTPSVTLSDHGQSSILDVSSATSAISITPSVPLSDNGQSSTLDVSSITSAISTTPSVTLSVNGYSSSSDVSLSFAEALRAQQPSTTIAPVLPSPPPSSSLTGEGAITQSSIAPASVLDGVTGSSQSLPSSSLNGQGATTQSNSVPEGGLDGATASSQSLSSSSLNGEGATTQSSIVPGSGLDGATGSSQSLPFSSASHSDQLNTNEVVPQTTQLSTAKQPGNGVTSSQLGSTAQPDTSAFPSSTAISNSHETQQDALDIAHRTSSSIASGTPVSSPGAQGSSATGSQTSPSLGLQTDTQVQAGTTQGIDTLQWSLSSEGAGTPPTATSIAGSSSHVLPAGETTVSNAKNEANSLAGAVTTATGGPQSLPVTSAGAGSSTVIPAAGTTINSNANGEPGPLTSGVNTATVGIPPVTTLAGGSVAVVPGETIKTSANNNQPSLSGEAASGLSVPDTQTSNEGSVNTNTIVSQVVPTASGNGAGATITHAAEPASSAVAPQSVAVPATGTSLGSETGHTTAGLGETQPTLTPGVGAGPTSQVNGLSGSSVSVPPQLTPVNSESQAGGSPRQTTLPDGAVVSNTAQVPGAAMDTTASPQTPAISVSSPGTDQKSSPNLNVAASVAASVPAFIANPSVSAAASRLNAIPASIENPLASISGNPPLVFNPALTTAASAVDALPASIQNPEDGVSLPGSPNSASPVTSGGPNPTGVGPQDTAGVTGAPVVTGSIAGETESPGATGLPTVGGTIASVVAGTESLAGVTGPPVATGSSGDTTAGQVSGLNPQLPATGSVVPGPNPITASNGEVVSGAPIATGSSGDTTAGQVSGPSPQLPATGSVVPGPNLITASNGEVVSGAPIATGSSGETTADQVSELSPKLSATGSLVPESRLMTASNGEVISGIPVATAPSGEINTVSGPNLQNTAATNVLPESGPTTTSNGQVFSGTAAPNIPSSPTESGIVGLSTQSNGEVVPVSATAGIGSIVSNGQVVPVATESARPESGIAGLSTQSNGEVVAVSAAAGTGSTVSNGQIVPAATLPAATGSATPESGIAGYSTQPNGEAIPISAAAGTGSTVSNGQIVPAATDHEASAQPPGPSDTGAVVASIAAQSADAAATQTNAAPPGPTVTPAVPPPQQFTGKGPYTQSPVGYDTSTTQVVPTSIIHGPSSTPSATQGHYFGPSSLPSNVPQILYQNGGPGSQPPNTRMVYIAFRYPLNYLFVYNHTVSQQQIFYYIPLGISYGLEIEVSQITMQSLRAWDTYEDVGYVTTLALAWIPEDLVNNLGLLVSTPLSRFYRNPDNSTAFLLSMINNAIPITGGNGTDGATTPFGNIPPDATSAKTAGAPIGGDIGNSEHVRASSMAIGLGVACGAAAYGAAMFFVARRYKKRRQSHMRSPSMFSSPVMSHAGPDAGAGAALMSGAMGERNASPYYDNDDRAGSRGSGRSGSSRHQISAPVMAENSLGWN